MKRTSMIGKEWRLGRFPQMGNSQTPEMKLVTKYAINSTKIIQKSTRLRSEKFLLEQAREKSLILSNMPHA